MDFEAHILTLGDRLPMAGASAADKTLPVKQDPLHPVVAEASSLFDHEQNTTTLEQRPPFPLVSSKVDLLLPLRTYHTKSPAGEEQRAI